MSLRRRWMSNGGWLTLLALLCVAATLLVTAAPRLVNRYTDEGLREWIASLGYAARDVSYVVGAADRPPHPGEARAILGDLRWSMAPPLRDRVVEAWYATQAGGVATGPDLARRGAEAGVRTFLVSLRDQSGAAEAVRLVDGQWPRNLPAVGDRVAGAVSVEVAETFGLQVGSTMDIRVPLAGDGPPPPPVPVRVVGIFEPLDPEAPIWAEEPEVLHPAAPIGTDPPEPWSGVLLTDTAGISHAAPRLGVSRMTWRFRIDEAAITAADLPALTAAVLDARSQDVIRATTVTTLDSDLADFARTESSARALVAVVQSGVVATLFGLVVLAALTATGRRRGEFALLRARGASLTRIGGRLFAESWPVVAVAVGLGSALSLVVPGRPGSHGWLAVGFGLVAALTAPVLAAASHRRIATAAPRRDLARPRVSPRRITAEVTLVVVAVAGVLVLRQRGLGQQLDLYLALLPALVAAAGAVLALRLLPYPMRVVTAAAARARGAVAFLGLARAGRAASASAGAVVVLVIAVSAGPFSAPVAGSIGAARDQVAERAVPGDAIVTGGRYAPATLAELAAAPSVTAVAPMTIVSGQAVSDPTGAWALTGVTTMVVDASAFDRVLRAAGRAQSVPAALLAAPGPDGLGPAVVSPEVASALGGAGTGGIRVRDRVVSFTVANVAERFPGLGEDARFVVLPWSALSSDLARALEATGFVLAGANIDIDAIVAICEAEQRARVSRVLGRPYEGPVDPVRALTYAQARADLERAGIDRVLDFTFSMGLGAGLSFALLAVGFAVASGARDRGQALSRLRTMGLTPRQGRWLLAWELLPAILLGALVGSAVGGALPVLLGPALGLSAFSDGGEVVFALDPRLPGLAFGLVLAAVVVAALVEASINRRAGLGSVLRVGRESS